MDNQEIINFLTQHKENLDIAGLFSNICREAGFAILKELANLWNFLAGNQSKALDLLDLSSYPKISQMIQDYQPYGIMIAAVCVVGLGFMIMRDKESDLQKVLTNIAVATVLFVGTPLFITNLNQVTKGISKAILDDTNPATEVFAQNVTDLYKLDEANWEGDWGETTTIINAPGYDNEVVHSGNYPNYFGEGDEGYLTMAITEVLPVASWTDIFKDSDDVQLSDEAKEALKYKLGYVKGDPKLYKLENKWLNVDEAYYRYTWHPWIIFFTLLSGIIVSVFLIWRLIHLEMELGFSGIWAQLTSFTDLQNGKRNIQLIQTIVNCSVVIIAIFLLQKLNNLAWLYVDTLDWGLPLKVLTKLAVSAFIVNGPNVIEQMFGIDSGTKGFMQSVTGAVMGMNAMMGLGRNAKNMTKSMGKSGAQLASNLGQGMTHGVSALGGAAKEAGNSIFQKGQDMSTSAMNKPRNQRAESYGGSGGESTQGNPGSAGIEGSRLSKHTRSNTRDGSAQSKSSVMPGNRQSGRGGNTTGQQHSTVGSRNSRNVLGSNTRSGQLKDAMQGSTNQGSSYSPMSNSRRQLSAGGTTQSVFPKANFSTRTMRRNQARLNDALQSKRPYNQSRSQLKEFAKQNKEILRSDRS